MSQSAPMPAGAPVIGAFDSGVGGLTVLAALRRRLPAARLLYAADSAYAPYGERDRGYVLERSRRLASFLLEQGAQMLVVACNTATALAIGELRGDWPDVPLVGIEPAIKPALAGRRDGDGPVGVLATPGTLASDRFRSLLARQRGGDAVLLQACPGLAEAIETHGPQGAEPLALLRQFCVALQRAGCTRVVLGCTHYPLLAGAIREAFAPREVELLDPADAVAAQALRLAQDLPARGDASLQAWSNGDPRLLQRVAQACGLALHDVLPLPEPAARPPSCAHAVPAQPGLR